jgi:hypothetical protein
MGLDGNAGEAAAVQHSSLPWIYSHGALLFLLQSGSQEYLVWPHGASLVLFSSSRIECTEFFGTCQVTHW